jgi:hypothetical protein
VGGNGAGCDVGRILDRGQIEDGLHRGRAAPGRRETYAGWCLVHSE